MKAAGIINKDGPSNRILGAGFHAVAEYTAYGQLVGSRGSLSTHDAWARVAQLALSDRNAEAADRASRILLGDMFVAALGLEGGGVVLAVVEGPVVSAVADQLVHALDVAVGDFVGPVPASYAVLVGFAILALFFFSGRDCP